METEVIRHRNSISIITVVYPHAFRRAASYSVLPGLQLRLQTVASAETTEASVAFIASAVAATVAVASESVATTADISFALSTTTSYRRTMKIMQHRTRLHENCKYCTHIEKVDIIPKKSYFTGPVRYVPLKVAVPYVLKALYRTYFPSKDFSYHNIGASIIGIKRRITAHIAVTTWNNYPTVIFYISSSGLIDINLLADCYCSSNHV
jgi:hypothetical protein